MSLKLLKHYANCINIAHELTQEQLNEIGNKVVLGYEEDKKSMSEWLSDVKEIEELASLEVTRKDAPLQNSANIKLPLITKACYEFSSRTYPAIIKDKQLVKSIAIGQDSPEKQKQGKKCSDFMNYQLLIKDQDWEIEQDRLLFLVALIGWICKKEYYDPVHDKIKIRLCDHKKLFVNSNITSLKDAPRLTEEIELTLNDVVARKHKTIDGLSVFLEEPVDELYEEHKLDSIQKPICFLEQQVELDLDEDGITEPYIATVLKSNGKVFRIAPRYHEDGIQAEKDKVICIYPISYYVDYHFLPNPKGKYQSVGFGILLLHLNNSANSVMNALLDSARLANMKAGYMDARLKVIPTGNSYHDAGEFKLVKVLPGASIKDGIYQHQYGEPSSVLFQLLGLLIQTAKDLSGSTEILAGTQNSQNAKTGATLALLQQGKAPLDAIQKRIYRSLDVEFKNLFDLNALYLDSYQFIEYAGGSLFISKNDFDVKKVHILPTADPNLSSDQERLSEAQFVQQIRQDPTIDPVKSMQFILSRTNIPGIESILADPNQAKPNPEALKLQADMEEAGQRLNLEGHKMELNHQIENKKLLIQAHLAEAQIVSLIAKAESLHVQDKLKELALQFQAISKQLDVGMDLTQMMNDNVQQQSSQTHQVQSQQADQQHQMSMQQSQQQADQQQNPSGDQNDQQQSEPGA